MSALKLRERVEAALTAAQIQLGTYALPNGEQVPAINLGDPPEGTTADGLECVIAPNPKMVRLDAFCPILLSHYPIRLINHNDDPDVLQDATNALLAVFLQFWDEPQVLTASADYPEQATFSFEFDPSREE